ncbi:hypothetical protein BUALT_Bualt14G0127600 [Buddleja alternifolia]|uniref:F-box domain-containing protein n=1 Tax=Buddleja alternifolia TaxID=168488 RepID=A0AAV6WU49_9LAMI|nr:hypothetical protein BUALT_Bualt14G0127600 [Buddleja alternifolia]
MTGWADLPNDLLSLILSNLFGLDRYTFSLVCKSWNAALAISPYRHMPCLMYYKWRNRVWNIFQYNVIFNKKFPKVPRAEIHCSKYGWLLMARLDCSLFFFDPFNRRRIYLPRSNFRYIVICFFHKPTSPDCFIVGIANRLNGLSVDIGNIATFDVNKHGSKTSWIVHTKCLSPPRLRQNLRQHILIKICDMLFAVLVAHEERKVNVFKLLGPDMKRKVVKDLGDKMFYVSHTACFAHTDPQTSMANKIYFPKFHGDDGVFYSLETRKYQSFKDDYSSEESYHLKDLDFATWIMPTPFEEFSRDLSWCPKVDDAIPGIDLDKGSGESSSLFKIS